MRATGGTRPHVALGSAPKPTSAPSRPVFLENSLPAIFTIRRVSDRASINPQMGMPEQAPRRLWLGTWRQLSCLISCTQSGPFGGRSAGDGRQGSMKPGPYLRVLSGCSQTFNLCWTACARAVLALARRPRGRNRFGPHCRPEPPRSARKSEQPCPHSTAFVLPRALLICFIWRVCDYSS
jgi:hypothetical protein